MINPEEIEELLPFPIKVEICCDSTDFKTIVKNSFSEILTRHNKNYETKIGHIIRHYLDEDDSLMERNDCCIFVGKEVVQYIKFPNSDTSEEYDGFSQQVVDYYWSIISITEKVLDTWHDKIVEIQEENNSKLEKYKLDGYDEILYGYYLLHSDAKAFQHLKKLATRYPNSKYMNRLRRVYRLGSNGWHRKNRSLSYKIDIRQHDVSYENF